MVKTKEVYEKITFNDLSISLKIIIIGALLMMLAWAYNIISVLIWAMS